MKKYLLSLIFIFVLFGAYAQKVWIQDTTIRNFYKNIAAGSYANNFNPCSTCFDAQDSLYKTAFLNYTFDWMNVKYLSVINLSNAGLTNLNELQYYGWGKDPSSPSNGYMGTIGINCSHNNLTSVDYNIIPKNLAYYNFSYNNIKNGVSLCDQYKVTNSLYNEYVQNCPIIGVPFELDFSYNNIVSIPSIGSNTEPCQIPTINLSHNQIQSIDYSNAPMLANLNLSYNKFKYFMQDLPPIDVFFAPASRGLINLSHNDSLTRLFIRGTTGYNALTFTTIDNSIFFNIDASYCSIDNALFSWDIGTSSSHTANFLNINLSHNKLTHLPGFSDNIINQYWGLYVDTLNVSNNNIQNADFTERFSASSSTGYGNYLWNKVFFKKVDLSTNNMNNIVGDFPSNLFYNQYISTTAYNFDIDFSNNNLQCFPKIPSWINRLHFDTNKVSCLPNVGAYYINNSNSLVYASCNATNNVHHCQSFPTVTGKIYLDINNNNIKDTTDEWMDNFEVTLKTSSGKIYRSFTDNDGTYSISGDTLGKYVIYVRAPLWNSTNHDSIVGNFTQFDSTYVQDTIRLQLTTILDSLAVSKYVTSSVRANRDFYFDYYIQNLGSTKLNPAITIDYDTSKVVFANNNCGALNNAAGQLVKTYNNFKPGNTASCYSVFYPKISLSIGDTIKFIVKTTYATAIKIDTLYATVIGSFDPNDKYATPQLTTTQVANGDYIDYTVHFQNTGNDTAFTVVIADTLSSLLQANSFQLMGSSHNCKTIINGNKVYFEFINIQLPDSNINQLGSNGFVYFKVKPISTLIAGNIIPNTASIYFDYNKPVLTNIANTKIVIPAVVTPLTFTNYTVKFSYEKQVLNKWTTANEINVSHYNIQRSTTGKDFVIIGKVKANNKNYNEYNFKDLLTTNYLLTATLYYRIVGVDNDGNMNYSEVRNIEQGARNNELRIFPNPAKDKVTIECVNAKQILINDYLGRTVKQLNLNADKLILDSKLYAKGIYIVKIFTNRGEVLTEKLVIE